MHSVEQTTDRTATAGPSSSQGARRVLAGGLAGAVMVGSALLGSGAASAAPAPDCDPLPTIGPLVSVCLALKGTVSGATGAVQTVPRTVPSAVAVAPTVVGGTTRAATGALGGVVGGANGPTAPSKAAVPSRSASAAGSSGVAPAAPATAAPAATPNATPAAAPAMTYVAAFDALPASFLSSAAPGASLSALGGLGTGAYDPGLLLTSSAPQRALAPSPVASGSTASPMSFLSEHGRVGTPVLLTVLSVAVLAALGVRSAVLRRARRRGAAA